MVGEEPFTVERGVLMAGPWTHQVSISRMTSGVRNRRQQSLISELGLNE